MFVARYIPFKSDRVAGSEYTGREAWFGSEFGCAASSGQVQGFAYPLHNRCDG